MMTQKRAQKESQEESGAFAVIPMEKLSGLDETLWLEQMAETTASKSSKKTDKNKKNTR